MTTTADLIVRTRRHLDGPNRRALAILSTPLTATGAGTTDITFSVGGDRVAEGNYLSAGLETMYVLTAPAPGSATVLRAQDGTTKQTHTVGETVRINDLFTDSQILDAINDELLALPAEGLFRVAQLTRTLDSTGGIDLADDMLDGQLLEVRWQPTTQWLRWWPNLNDYSVSTDVDTSQFPSGRALFFNWGSYPWDGSQQGQPVLITYRAPFDTLEALGDDVTDSTGLPDTAHDILPLGAAVRLLAGRPVARADYVNQGQTRRPTEVSTGDVLNSPVNLQRLRDVRVSRERSRLTGLYGAARQMRR